MPKGVRGFQPGRAKTGGKVEGGIAKQRRSGKFVERLKGYGFNYDKELADVLRNIKQLSEATTADPKDAVRRAELKFYYSELKSLLPFMTPKLREKQVEVVDEPDDLPQAGASISDKDLLEALNGKPTETDARPSSPTPVATRPVELPVSPSSEEYLPDVAGKQDSD